ncbi:putative motility protein [Sporosarcina sp. P12(2017)]|uniref:putative motility protein n=1 Tax=unclassified Sporosarcina TaxID=2647733 RepID=UPI000C16E248|nr:MULTISPECIES: putative motility protein [unclassified Sporosarcina]PIC56065.1 putative motility protein [Sporosarcina sp. P10]PIC59406.1 putative motility protein [Sporosarcina sp. P12(2017)]
MDINSIMSSQLRSLQSTVQMSVMNKALSMETSAMNDMLNSLENQPIAHPTKGASIDIKA